MRHCSAQITERILQGQLKNLLQSPFDKVCEEAYSVYDRACLDVIISTGLADYLGRAPDRSKGVHVDELQDALDIENQKLTIILRYLCTQGWVRETQESVFALNRSGYELLEGTNGRKRLMCAFPSTSCGLPLSGSDGQGAQNSVCP